MIPIAPTRHLCVLDGQHAETAPLGATLGLAIDETKSCADVDETTAGSPAAGHTWVNQAADVRHHGVIC